MFTIISSAPYSLTANKSKLHLKSHKGCKKVCGRRQRWMNTALISCQPMAHYIIFWVENPGIEITTTCHGHLLQLLVKPELKENVSPLALLPSAYKDLGIGMHLRRTHTSLHTLKTTVSHPCFLTIVLQVCLSEPVTLLCTPPTQRLDQGTDFLSSLFNSWEDLQGAAQGLLASCWGVKHPWWRSPRKGCWGYLPNHCLEGSNISTPSPYGEPTYMFSKSHL